MYNKNNSPKNLTSLQKGLTEEEKLKMFEIEELEGRLETSWNEGCTKNKPCDDPNSACEPQK
jgi:hypothetical protein